MKSLAVLVLGGALVVAWAMVGRAADEGEAAAQAERTIVLDTAGFWRMHHTLRPPMIASDDGPKPILYGQRWLDEPTSPAPAGWTAPDFDDSGWVRAVTLRAAKTPYLAQLCLRGKFEVTDPSRVRGLKLTVGYHGGAVVYLNGREIARGHLPEGPVKTETLAEGYPPEVSVMPDGQVIHRRMKGSEERTRRQGLRERTLADVAIPPGLLHKGVNVIAIEIVRAPYPNVHEQARLPDRGGKPQYILSWYSCEIRNVRLTAESADGLVPNVARPAGLQVWNSDPRMSDFDMDFGDPCEPLRPVKIVATRNGAFSGKVVVGCDTPILGFKASAGALKRENGTTIPSSAVRLRYALPWGEEWITIPYTEQRYPYPRPADVLVALAESPPDEIPVRQKEAPRRRPGSVEFAEPVLGAVVPVWITVAVPADARPGAYTGEVRIEAAGQRSVEVPVEVEVVDWRLPDAQDWQTWVELIESPDTLVAQYGLRMWSERHWKMIEQAFRYIGEAGARMVHVPLIAQTNLGHEESMVRWVRRGDGGYEYDFRILDRYLDAAEKYMGRPKLICFWVWEIYLIEQEKYHGKDHLHLAEAIAEREAMRGQGPMVTQLDAATGKTETIRLPRYEDPVSKALWAPLLAKLKERLEARGLTDTMMIGMINDTRPTKEEVAFWNDLLPGVPWVSEAHGGFRQRDLLQGIAPIGYQARVWTLQFSSDGSLHGWNTPFLLTHYDRDRQLNPKTPALWQHLGEMCITGNQRGIGRVGADYWPIYRDKRGRLSGYVWGRYLHSSWRNLDLYSHALVPGPEGPVAAAQFEALREGIEHCEARIFLEKVLLDETLRAKIGEPLAARCQKILDDRQMAMVRSMAAWQMENPNDQVTRWMPGCEVAGHMWFVGSGWQERSRELFTVAGEAAAKVRRK